MPRFTLLDKFGNPATTLRLSRLHGGVRVEAEQAVREETATRRLGELAASEVPKLRI